MLEDTEALALFSRIVGEERAAAEPDATAEVLVACAGLPLAIRICAARLAARRQWQIATLAGRLRNQHRRLDELKIGDLAVRASFQVSYDSLQAARPRHRPGARLPAARPVAGSVDQPAGRGGAARRAGGRRRGRARSLVDVNLLESPAPDWYRFHDLLKVYATERAQAEEPEAVAGRGGGQAAVVVPGHRASRGGRGVTAAVPGSAASRAAPGYPPLSFATVEDALAWYDDERANIVAATRQAAAVGLHEVAWRLPPHLVPAVQPAEQLGGLRYHAPHRGGERAQDRRQARRGLGAQPARLRAGPAARPRGVRHLEQALAIRQELGDTRGEAQTAIALGEGHLRMHGAGEDALRYLRQAADLLEPMGCRSLRSVALNNLGEVYFELGDLDAAAECYRAGA